MRVTGSKNLIKVFCTKNEDELKISNSWSKLLIYSEVPSTLWGRSPLLTQYFIASWKLWLHICGGGGGKLNLHFFCSKRVNMRLGHFWYYLIYSLFFRIINRFKVFSFGNFTTKTFFVIHLIISSCFNKMRCIKKIKDLLVVLNEKWFLGSNME